VPGRKLRHNHNALNQKKSPKRFNSFSKEVATRAGNPEKF